MFENAELSTKFVDALLEIAAVCRKHKLQSMHATVIPGHDMPDCQIELGWTSGRHYAEEGKAKLSYSKTIIRDIPLPG